MGIIYLTTFAQSDISTSPSSLNSSSAGIASHSQLRFLSSSSDRERRMCKAILRMEAIVGSRPTSIRAFNSWRLASRMTPSPHCAVKSGAVRPSRAIEACHTGRPELTVSHLLTVTMSDQGTVSNRNGWTSPLARESGCSRAYRCISVISLLPG